MKQNEANNWANSLTDGTPLQSLVSNSSPTSVRGASDIKKMPTMHVGSGYRFGNLTWFPVWTDQPVTKRSYTTSKSKKFLVSEMPQASVATLEVENQAEQDLLLLEGMILEGGWQHRALTQSILIPSRSKTQIPVVCVEQHRWGGSSAQSTGDKVAPAGVRVAMRGLLTDNRGNVSQAGPDQARVWSNVSSYQSRSNVSAPTASLVDIQDGVKRGSSRTPSSVTALPGQRGVVVAVLGQPIAFELFDHPDTLAERLQGMLESYSLDAQGRPYKKTPGQSARDFVLQVSKLKLDAIPEAQGSNRLRSKNARYVAAEALRHQGDLVHLSCINSQHELVLAA
jgi:hypothetical protein